MAKRGFLSYAHEDRSHADQLYQDLKRSGISVWYDQVDRDPGQDLDQQIFNAIRESSFIVVLLSRISAAKQGYIRKEIGLALDIQRHLKPAPQFIIPVRLEECLPRPEETAGLHSFIDLFPDRESGLRQITTLIDFIVDEQSGGDPASQGPHTLQVYLTDLDYLGNVARKLRSRSSISVFLENCASELSGVEPGVVSDKVRNIRSNLMDFAACIELHFTNGCGALDPDTICHVCGARGSIVHGHIDIGGFSPSDYNDNYISWCVNCFWADHWFEIDYLGSGPLKFNHKTNTYG